MKKKDASFSLEESNSSDSQLDFREKLKEFYLNSPLHIDELMTSFGLFLRGSALVKYLVLNDLYQRIVNIPGNIVEFGTCWGQNMVVFENLRAIYEPFNKTRKIIGFDTFEGYKSLSTPDKKSSIFKEGQYHTIKGYKNYLKELLSIHEGNNVLGHIRNNHEIIEGDVCKTAPEYFNAKKESIIALAYFDMGLYKPTKIGLESIKPHLISGSVLLMDELTWSEAPGEAAAFKEVFTRNEYSMEKSKFTPMRVIVTIK